jgi:hypothetical protein
MAFSRHKLKSVLSFLNDLFRSSNTVLINWRINIIIIGDYVADIYYRESPWGGQKPVAKDSQSDGEEPTHKFYKYMTLERFMGSYKDYLEGKLYFADRDKLNDPMENIPLPRRVKGENGRSPIAVYDKLKTYKICSMTVTPRNLAMWSYYAKDHSGVCVGFTLDPEDVLAHRGIECIEVKSDIAFIPVIRDIDKPEDITREVREKLFCRKLADWRHEGEWQLLKPFKPGESRMVKIGAAMEIILGYNCTLDFTAPYFNLPEITVKQVKYKEEGEGISLYVPGDVVAVEGRFQNAEWDYEIMNHGAVIHDWYGESHNVNIPDKIDGRSVVAIGERTFVESAGLASVSIPVSVVDIGLGTFAWKPNLKSISVGEGNPKYYSDDGILYSEGNKIISYPSASGKITIPETVDKIERHAFCGCSELISVTFLRSVCISYASFDDCENLEEVIFANSVDSIEYEYKCDYVNDVEIPNLHKDARFDVGVSYSTVFKFNNKTNMYNGYCPDLAIACEGETKEIVFDNLVKLLQRFFSLSIKYNVTVPPPTSFEKVKEKWANYEVYFASFDIHKVPACFRPFFSCKNLKQVLIPKTVSHIKKDLFSEQVKIITT